MRRYLIYDISNLITRDDPETEFIKFQIELQHPEIEYNNKSNPERNQWKSCKRNSFEFEERDSQGQPELWCVE